MDIYQDPNSPLAKRAAEDVRAMFTARIGEHADSHQQWNQETTRSTQALVDGIVDRLNNEDPPAALEFAARWAGMYLGASSLLAEQLLRAAVARAYVFSGGDVQDEAAGLEFMLRWSDSIVGDVFKMLIEDGRTIV